MASFKPRGVAGGGGWRKVGFATIQLPQPRQAGTWAELGNKSFLTKTFETTNNDHPVDLEKKVMF